MSIVMNQEAKTPSQLSMRRIFQTWWPLAASWFFMALELPIMSAVVARLPNPNINLAAWGGVVFPLALLIESPIIMMLAASTTLSKDWDSYQKLRRFMMQLSGALLALHILVAFTPVYDFVVVGLIGAPEDIVEPARIGLRIMVPWSWAIAFRRFNQGVLIRFGHSEAVGIGTVIRLSADGVVLLTGLVIGTVPGIVVASIGITIGVIAEAAYAWWRVQPVLRDKLKAAPKVDEPLTTRLMLSFYIPLAMTSLLTLSVMPIGSAAMSRMPRALESLAILPVLSGTIFMFRSFGVALNEVVVALLDEQGATRSLVRFARFMFGGTTVLIVLVAGTPLSFLWFERVSALAPQLTEMARLALWIALPMPGLNVLQSWFQGIILHSRRTRGITEAVGISLLTTVVILVVGVVRGRVTGLYVGWLALCAGSVAQTIWLWMRSRPTLIALEASEEVGV
jgi:hypothetical protein